MENENGIIYTSQRRYNPNGRSYKKRVEEVNKIYNAHSRDGATNAHIWRNYIYPIFGISVRTFYNYLKRSL